MNPWRWVDPRVRSVRLAGVRAYLVERGWETKPSTNPLFVRFEPPAGKNNGQSLFQVLPSSDRGNDFVQSITYFLTTMSELEDRHPVEVLDEVLRHQEREAKAIVVGEDGRKQA